MLTYSNYSKALGVLFGLCLLTTPSCGSKSESSDAACPAGGEHCSCPSNGECNAGLICATNLGQCVRLATTGSGGDATGSGGSGSGGTTAAGGSTGAGGAVATGGISGGAGRGGSGGSGGSGGTTGTGGSAGRGGATGTGGSAGRGGSTGTGGNGTGGSSATGGSTGTGGSATGGTPGTGGVTSTSCTLTNHSGNGSFTYYYFGQGTAKDGSGYRTACGYYGTESGQVDTIQNIANTSPAKNTYFAAIPGQNGFDSKSHCGECVQITGQNGKQVIATIIDECPYGNDGNNSACAANAGGHLDLSVDVFNQLGYSTGNPSGTNWKFVPCPVTGNIVARVKPGNANELFLENSILAITGVAGASRTSYGTWHFGGNLSSGQSIQLTDEANRQVTIQLSSTSQGQNQDTGKQFPACQ
jgi:hypothetical protein